MMSIDRFLTIISIIVTVLSIGCSIWAFVSAKGAKRYRNEVLQLVGNFGLEELLTKFRIESSCFLGNTRSKDWYRGRDVAPIISPFKEVLSSFGKFYHLVNDSNALENKVHELNEIIYLYEEATPAQKKRVNNLSLEIMEVLEIAIRDNTQKFIKH